MKNFENITTYKLTFIKCFKINRNELLSAIQIKWLTLTFETSEVHPVQPVAQQLGLLSFSLHIYEFYLGNCGDLMKETRMFTS